MLTEDDVVEAVCRHLPQTGHEIVSRCSTNQRGIDIVARDGSGATLRVECKGEGSNKPWTARYGKSFSAVQCHKHVAVAFCTAAELLGTYPGDQVALAFPDTKHHRDYLGRISSALARLNVAIFWVDAERHVYAER